jgi:5-methylcytosine-specific restriction endonuclease McrA
LAKNCIKIGKCAYCGATENLTCDHIVPLMIGGQPHKDNLQCLCYDCNQEKQHREQRFFKDGRTFLAKDNLL